MAGKQSRNKDKCKAYKAANIDEKNKALIKEKQERLKLKQELKVIRRVDNRPIGKIPLKLLKQYIKYGGKDKRVIDLINLKMSNRIKRKHGSKKDQSIEAA